MVRLFVGGRNSHAESNALGHCSHGAYNGQGLVDWPLCARNLRSIEVAIIDIIATEHISHEYTMDLGFFEQLRKLYPVFDVVELVRMVVRMSPQTWRLVATTCWASFVSQWQVVRSSCYRSV
jgi:hypothetical protein